MASFTVIYDACVLYPAPLRDLLIRIARSGIVRARWSDQILDEMVTAILRNRPDLKAGDLDRTRRLMTSAVEDSIVARYEPLIPAIDLPDPKDCHVVAAAIRASAQAIVTFNLRDFPDHDLERWNIEAKHPESPSRRWPRAVRYRTTRPDRASLTQVWHHEHLFATIGRTRPWTTRKSQGSSQAIGHKIPAARPSRAGRSIPRLAPPPPFPYIWGLLID